MVLKDNTSLYRPEIDGLRAIAVLSVIFFHAGFDFFHAGYIGVDIFFCITGFLIATKIISALQNNQFSLLSFYERRIRRLIPALFAVLALAIPFSWILLPPTELASFSESLIATVLFLSNIFFYRDGGYFEISSELKPLLHTWTLGIEVQYYALFPLFLMLLWKFKPRIISGALLVVTLLSLILSQLASIYWPSANFFMLPTRAWELLIGAVIALTFLKNNYGDSDVAVALRQFLSFFGILLIALSILIFKKNTLYPSLYTLLPVLGSSLILLFATKDTCVGKILGKPLFASIGLISYSAYLLHQPIFSFSRFWFTEINIYQKISLIILTLITSSIVWRYIERPFRDHQFISRKYFFILFSIASIFIISFGFLSSKFFHSPNVGIEEKMAKILTQARAIYTFNIDERKFIKHRIKHENLEPKIVIIGSSRIMQLGENLDNPNVLLNLAVSGASLQDHIAIAEMAASRFKPQALFIGADPWLLDSKFSNNRWRSLQKEYDVASSNLKMEIPKSEFRDDNIAYDNYIYSIYNAINKYDFVALNYQTESRDKIRRDGIRIYNATYSSKTEKEIHKQFEVFLDEIRGYSTSNQLEDSFNSYIRYHSRKLTAVIVLVPYHPELYKLIKRNHLSYLESESKFRRIAHEHGVDVIGSYNPDIVGCQALDFYDGIHPKPSCINKIMDKVGYRN